MPRDINRWIIHSQFVIDSNTFFLVTDYVAVTTPTNVAVGRSTVPAMSVFGWIIIHQKSNASSFNWNLTWSSYKNGFGSTAGDSFWFGLESMHVLTTSRNYRLRVEVVQQSTGRWYSAEYGLFKVGDEAHTMYTLNVDGSVRTCSDHSSCTSSDRCIA